MKINTIQEAKSFLMEYIPSDIFYINDIFKKNGISLFLCGGSVRDSFFGKAPKDFDLCTNAMPDQVMDVLTSVNIPCEPRGVEFGVIVAKGFNGDEYEIATFRSDVSGGTGNLMDDEVVLGVTIEEDVKRRDLTINALFFDLNKCEIIDLVGGIEDLKIGIIRTVGNPEERFAEDSTRKLRVVTRALKTNFFIESITFNSIKNNPKLNCNKERVFAELEKMNTNFDLMHTLLLKTNLIFEIFPGLNISKTKIVKNINIFSVFVNFLYDNEIENITKILANLKFSNNYINNITFLIKYKKLALNTVNPFVFFQDKKKCNIVNEELLLIFNNDKNLFELLKFIPNKDVSNKFINEGFSGPELGNKIKEFYFETRSNIF